MSAVLMMLLMGEEFPIFRPFFLVLIPFCNAKFQQQQTAVKRQILKQLW